MADFCIECFNKINETNLTTKEVVISKELNLCEECEEWKNVIICIKKRFAIYNFIKKLK